MTEDVKPDYYSRYETRPTTPLPNAAHQITMDVYLEKSRNMSMKENNKLSRDTQIKKILLDLLEKYPDMWEVTDMNADKERWQELGIELYSFTGKVVGEAVLRLMFGNLKGLMKRKLKDFIDNHGSSHQDMEIAIREWELYRHFRWYRRHISEYEQALWDKKEVLDVVETDEVVYLGQYCNSDYVLQGVHNPAAVHHDEEMEYEDDSEEEEIMETEEAPVEAPVRNAPGQQDKDVEDVQNDAQNEEMDEEEDDHLQDGGEEDQAEVLAPAPTQEEIIKQEVQDEAVAAIVEQVPAQSQRPTLTARCFECVPCMPYGTIEQLEAHIASVHLKMIPYKCVHCEYSRFPTEYTLINHYEKIHKQSRFDIVCEYSPEIRSQMKMLDKKVEDSMLLSHGYLETQVQPKVEPVDEELNDYDVGAPADATAASHNDQQ